MYADREEGANKTSIRQRLDRNTAGPDSSRRRLISGKRLRQDDDKWEHDLYGNAESKARKIGTTDLRLKLLKKSVQQATRSRNGSTSGVRDLREKLSGTMYSDTMDTARPKPKPVIESSKAVRKSVIVEVVPEPETKKVSTSAARKKTQPKDLQVESLDDFLHSLGLEKYSITFQAEEVDMATLVVMTEEDLKVLGIPMGPRKKILIALESRT